MSLKSDDNTLQYKDLVFILAIAGRIDAQTRLLAQTLDKNRHVYYAYAVFDSLSSSYSMFKYFFDVCIGGSAEDMHDVMLNPVGIIGITLETLFLVSFSFLASYFEKESNKNKEEKETNYKKMLVMAWPYFRDVMKGLKNAYKGWRSTIAVINLLGGQAGFLLLPVGLTLGLLGLVNRCLIRAIIDSRKKMMAHNKELLLVLSKLPSLTKEQLEVFLKTQNHIKYQEDSERYLGFLYSGVGGVIDGLYLYIGALTLTVFAPQLLIAMAILCAFYTLSCIVTRVYEEYEYQQMLVVTQTEIVLVATIKQIQTLYAQLLLLEEKADKTEEEITKIANLKKELGLLIEQFDATRKLFKQQTGKTFLTSVLIGLKHGLYAYGALSSILFFVGAILTLAGVSLPPVAVAIAISLGIALIAAYITHSLYLFGQQKKEEQKDTHQQLLKDSLLEKEEHPLLSLEQLNQSLQNDLLTAGFFRQKFYIQEGYEVVRSLFSGLGKGQKFVDFAGNPLQEQGEDGHYHDTPVLFVLSALSAVFFGVVLGLRALARGCRPQLDDRNQLVTDIFTLKENDINGAPPTVLEESGSMKRSNSLENVNVTRVSSLSMFAKGKNPKGSTHDMYAIPDDDKVVGLN